MKREVRSVSIPEKDLDVLEFINDQPGSFSQTVIQAVRKVQEQKADDDFNGEVLLEILSKLEALQNDINHLKQFGIVGNGEHTQQHALKVAKPDQLPDYSALDDL